MTAAKKAAPKTVAPVDPMAALPLEVPAAVRDAAEKGLEQMKDSYAKLKTMAEETTDVMEDTFSTASKGVTDFNLKALDLAKENANSGFDFAKSLLGVKTLSEAIELQSGFVRTQSEALMAQSKELGAMVQKVAEDTTKPVQVVTEKAMKDFKLAS